MRSFVVISALQFASGLITSHDTIIARPNRLPAALCRPDRASALFTTADGDDDAPEGDEYDGPVTKEMFMRDMLADPKVRRKKRNGRYRTMDNRDSLPFVVQVSTPDPYTSNEEMKREARNNTKVAASKKTKGSGGRGGTARRNLVGMDAPGTKDGIASSIYSRMTDGSLHRVLGEFTLDKHTNCGDLIEVGDREYEVQKARCQYKYAGGKRFVMVRKILEVKEVTRIAEENYLKRQFQNSVDDESLPALE